MEDKALKCADTGLYNLLSRVTVLKERETTARGQEYTNTLHGFTCELPLRVRLRIQSLPTNVHASSVSISFIPPVLSRSLHR